MRKLQTIAVVTSLVFSLALAPSVQAKAKITKPSAPKVASVKFSELGDGLVNVTFVINLPKKNGGSKITGSKVVVGGRSCTMSKLKVKCTISGLKSGKTYIAKTASKNSKGWSGYGSWEFVTPTTTAPTTTAPTTTAPTTTAPTTTAPTPTPSTGTLVIDAQGLETYCEYGLLGPTNIPMIVSGGTSIPNLLPDGNESFSVLNGNYLLTPGVFNCNGVKYSPILSSVSVTVSGGTSSTVVISYEVIAEIMFGRTWNDGNGWWRVPLGVYPENVNFDAVQFRFVGEEGAWRTVHASNWYVDGLGRSRNLLVVDLAPTDLEFRVVKYGYKNGNYQVVKVWYSPYTCGYDTCTYPTYSLLDSPLN